MTNYELWKLYMKGNHAPRQFMDAGWIFMIAAALERRVWLNSSIKVFPNHYILMCGQPGAGKSIVTGPVNDILNSLTGPGHSETVPVYVLKRGPDSSSFEKIADIIAKSTTGGMHYTDEKGTKRPYCQACLRLELDEFTSVFKKHAEDAVTFFCSMWTGSMNYDRSTHKHGQVLLINPLLNFIAGTTPKAMQDLHKLNVIGRGLDRRLFIAYAARNEFRQAIIPAKTPEQDGALASLRAHLIALSKVCGPVSLSPEALEYFQNWWAEPNKCRINHDPRMNDYEANKNLPTLKLALVMHFFEGAPAEQLKKPISLETMITTIEWMRRFEVDRHYAYDYMGDNPMHITALGIQEWLKNSGPRAFAAILDAWHHMVTQEELRKIMEYLQLTGRVNMDTAMNYTERS